VAFSDVDRSGWAAGSVRRSVRAQHDSQCWSTQCHERTFYPVRGVCAGRSCFVTCEDLKARVAAGVRVFDSQGKLF